MRRSQWNGIPLLENGFLCCDQGSFFSTTRGGYGHQVERAGPQLRLTMEEGSFSVTTSSAPGFTCHEIEVLEDSWIFDFVAHWVLPGAICEEATIGNELVPLGTPLMHAQPVTSVELSHLAIEFVGADTLPANLHAEMHLASNDDNWIVHARAVANEDEPLFVKHIDGHSEAFRGGPIERRVLLRRSEYAAPIYDFQARPHAKLAAGTKLRVGLALGDGRPAPEPRPATGLT